MISRLLLFFALVFAPSLLAAEVASLTFDYPEPVTGVTFEVQKKITGTADTLFAPAVMSGPTALPAAAQTTPGVPRYELTHPLGNPFVGIWDYRVRAVVNGKPSAWTAVENTLTVDPTRPGASRIAKRTVTTVSP
jgi:hypothetical protein